jgi:hypothetical protein
MIHFVGLNVSQKMTAICVVDNAGDRLWRGQCPTRSCAAKKNAEHFRRKRRLALISCRFKKSKQPFDIADALASHDAEFGEMGANGADKAAPLADQ